MGRLIKKTYIKASDTPNTVYDISVEKNHNYFAENVLVHNCKDAGSVQGTNLLKLQAPYKVGMTGTIIMNNPLDVYAPLEFINKVHKDSLTAFKQYFCNYNSFKQIIGFKNISTLKDILGECSLRRTKDLLQLPPKTIINEYVDMDAKHQQFYQHIVDGVVDEVDKVKMSTA